MSILILFVCLVSIFFCQGTFLHKEIKKKELLLRSVLIFSLLVVAITEVASYFHYVNFQGILLSWIIVLFFNLTFLFIRRRNLLVFYNRLLDEINSSFGKINKQNKLFIFGVSVILTLIFIQGIIYPPNNFDSMTYHMARIINWMSHNSIEYYPSQIFRQIYQPPFAEFVIMHFNILSFGDYLSNSVQFFFLLFSLIVIVLIVDLFGLKREYKLIAILLTITIPEVVLQAASTQNDLVVTFFILTSVYYSFKAIKELDIHSFIFLGISTGLGILTKGTAYIFLSPVLLIFGILILIKLVKTKKFSYLSYSLIAACICITINLSQYYRNYRFAHNLLGIDSVESKMYSNEDLTPILWVSSVIKNAGLHIAPYPFNKIANKVIYKLHKISGIEINSPKTNFENEKYGGAWNIPNHEDFAPNTIMFFLIILSFIWLIQYIIKSPKELNYLPKILLLIVLLQASLFCFYLKWQPWHTRLHTTLFMLSVPLCIFAFSLKYKYVRLLNGIIYFNLFIAFFIIIFNYTKPFISTKFTCQNSITDNRFKKYFADRPDLFLDYSDIVQTLESYKNINVGLIIGWDDWEYPIFSQIYKKNIYPVHIDVTNQTRDIPMKSVKIDFIVSTTVNDSVINFRNEEYHNKNTNNKEAWIYEKMKPLIEK